MDVDRDPGYLRFRRGSVRLASLTSLGALTLILAYVGVSWGERPDPHLVVALALVAGLSVLAVELLRAERLVDTRWCDLFFGSWSALYVVLIVLLMLADGGIGSPLALTFFLVLVFAGLCYPLRLAVQVGVACLAGYLAVALTTADVQLGEPLYFTGVLTLTAMMCAWQAQTLERQRRELAAASITDHLTGSFNRRGFHEHAERELTRAERSGTPVSLVLVDLDDFKTVNDRFGHAAGDELLCWVTERLRAGLRPSDLAARLGGDEFALLLPGVSLAMAEAVAERLRSVLAQRTSASFGIACYPARGSAEALLAQADSELYREKHARRGGGAAAGGFPVPDGFWA